MADENKHASDEQITPAGATELEENTLDDAAGGLSLNYSKIELQAGGSLKIAPGDLTGVKIAPGDLTGVKISGGR